MSDFSSTLKPAEPRGPEILQKERNGSDLDVSELAHHLHQRADHQTRQRRVLEVLESHPLFSKKNNLNLSRPDRFHVGLARAKELRRISKRLGWSAEDQHMADYLLDEVSPFALSNSMFATSLREQCSDEQKRYWIPRVQNWEITGCYAQTELGHGSNVRGIECEARWDTTAKEFIIHSPTLTASKWWNGSMGRLADHAVVVAQLLLPTPTGSKSFGPHTFVVQIRDLETRKPLPGIVVGDIGPKYGYDSMDNGYLLFNNFRVPRSALLARYSSVDENGKYSRAKNPATVYGSLTAARAHIIMHARLVLARAVTVAVRYTLIRRQFSDRDATAPGPEEAVLNYPTVQIRVLPLLATTFALHYVGEAMYNTYTSTRKQIEEQDNFSGLAEMHAVSSGLKSLCTSLAADGIETCRRALGGHGFAGGSGLIPLNRDYLSKPTVEGDNWMITQQTASYLIKRMQRCQESPTLEPRDQVDRTFLDFLRTPQRSFNVFEDDGDLVAAFKHRAAFLTFKACQARVEQKCRWTDMMVTLHNLSNAYCQALLVQYFADGVARPSPPLSNNTKDVLHKLFRLFAFYTLEKSTAEFIVSGILQPSQLELLTQEVETLMRKIRQHAARLVDAWNIPDYLIAGSLGRSDGDVYNHLFRTAHLENPLNLQTFNPDWRTEEIVLGEGADKARARIAALVQGTFGHEQLSPNRSKL